MDYSTFLIRCYYLFSYFLQFMFNCYEISLLTIFPKEVLLLNSNLFKGPYKMALIAVHHCGFQLPQSMRWNVVQLMDCGLWIAAAKFEGRVAAIHEPQCTSRNPRAECYGRNPWAAAIHESSFSWIAAATIHKQIMDCGCCSLPGG